MNTTTIVLKQIINNIVIRKRVFDHIKRINKQLKKKESECYKWVDIYSSFNLLVRFGYLNELKYRLENEEINSDLYKLYNMYNGQELKETIESNNNHEKIEEEIDHRIQGLGKIACRYGHLKIIEYFNQHHQSRFAFNKDDITIAIQHGHQEISEYLFDNKVNGGLFNIESIKEAAKKGYHQLLDRMLKQSTQDLIKDIKLSCYNQIDTFKVFEKYGVTDISLNDLICQDTSIEIIDYMVTKYPNLLLGDQKIEISIPFLNSNNINNKLEIIKYLDSKNKLKVNRNIMNRVAKSGNLEILKWMYDKYHFKCSMDGMLSLPVIQYLHQVHRLQLSRTCMDLAIRSDNLELIEYLYRNGVVFDQNQLEYNLNGNLNTIKFIEGLDPTIEYSTGFLDKMTSHGKLDIIEYLHKRGSTSFTPSIMTTAINTNHLDIVRFLHFNRTEGYYATEIDRIDTLEMFQFLHENRNGGYDFPSLSHWIYKGCQDIQVVKYYHFNVCNRFINDIPDLTASHNLDIIKFIKEYRVYDNIQLRLDSWYFCNNQILSYLIHNMSDHPTLTHETISKIITNYQFNDQDIPNAIERIELIYKLIKLKGWSHLDFINDWERQTTMIYNIAILKYLYLFKDDKMIMVMKLLKLYI